MLSFSITVMENSLHSADRKRTRPILSNLIVAVKEEEFSLLKIQR